MLEMKMMIAIKKPVLEFEYLDAQSLWGLNWFDSFILLLLEVIKKWSILRTTFILPRTLGLWSVMDKKDIVMQSYHKITIKNIYG